MPIPPKISIFKEKFFVHMSKILTFWGKGIFIPFPCQKICQKISIFRGKYVNLSRNTMSCWDRCKKLFSPIMPKLSTFEKTDFFRPLNLRKSAFLELFEKFVFCTYVKQNQYVEKSTLFCDHLEKIVLCPYFRKYQHSRNRTLSDLFEKICFLEK